MTTFSDSVALSEIWIKCVRKLLIFTGSSLILLGILNLLGSFGFMNDMRLGFTWRDVDLYEVSLDLIASVGLAVLCFFAARKQHRE